MTPLEPKTAVDVMLEVIKEDIHEIKQSLTNHYKELRETLGNHYVTQDKFQPVANVVYGLVAVLLLAVVGAMVALVIKK